MEVGVLGCTHSGRINQQQHHPCCHKLPTFHFGGSRLWQDGNALLPHGTRESSRNQDSEQSSATIVPQLSAVADMTLSEGELNPKPEDAAGTVGVSS